ncbi:hypothetical protein BUALT_Bualt08G0071800 [Buddleja alternifolia]|uniref:Uncharacterized protein n=1 Tax=Buddleja alternifolia TaxID=168488 RepID=A0AAV6XFG8_9LAMI|nr:hypothetical protein BUALT_Bualt08G0071800 [Buddleja alternifolia]
MDICEVCPEKLPNYEEKIKNSNGEHLFTQMRRFAILLPRVVAELMLSGGDLSSSSKGKHGILDESDWMEVIKACSNSSSLLYNSVWTIVFRS